MHLYSAHNLSIWLISLGSILCMLVRPWRIREAVWIAAGAILLVALHLMSLRSVAHAIGKGTDVYFFLAGMMLLAELARHEGVFDWLAGIAVHHARSSAAHLFLLIYGTGVAVTALLSNDATAVVLTPAVLAAVRRARVEPKPYLLSCALVANAASFLLPVSNPANLVVYGHHLPALGEWLRIFLLPSIASIAITFYGMRVLFRNVLCSKVETPAERPRLTPTGKVALGGLIAASVVLLTASGMGIDLGIPTCAAAVASLLAVSVKDRGIFKSAVVDISWSILPLVAGLFVLVEGLNNTGVLQITGQMLQWLSGQPRLPGYIVASGVAAILSNAMNNLPVALAAGTALQHAPQLAHAVLIGVDLGPNLSVTGSLATILWLIALRRDDVEMTRWQFLKAGLVLMPIALVFSIFALMIGMS
jgi:arsenical pump membrane protein